MIYIPKLVIPDAAYRILRGGSWGVLSWYCRSALRRMEPTYPFLYWGFRICKEKVTT